MLTEKARGATSPFEEDVRGMIIECPRTPRYEFWNAPTDRDPFVYYIGGGLFENDDEAIAYLRANVAPGRKIEMRVFD